MALRNITLIQQRSFFLKQILYPTSCKHISYIANQSNFMLQSKHNLQSKTNIKLKTNIQLKNNESLSTLLNKNFKYLSYNPAMYRHLSSSTHLNKETDNRNKTDVPIETNSTEENKTKVETEKTEGSAKKKLGQTAQLAKVFAEYGTIGIVFHTTLSLTSLGISYTIVSSGVDVVALMQKFNFITEVSTEAKVAGGASTFVIAYAFHKIFMPVRIFITVSATPMIVKKLRSIGLLKTPKKKNTAEMESKDGE